MASLLYLNLKMANQYKEYKTDSWLNRVQDSAGKVIVGLGLFIASFFVLFFNESNSLNRSKALQIAQETATPVFAGEVSAKHNGELVYFSGLATTSDIYEDEVFGVKEKALKMKRIVEMFQWVEKKEEERTDEWGGSQTVETIYTYERKWLPQLVSSSTFKVPEGHQNPESMAYESRVWTADKISMGAYTLSDSLIDQLIVFKPYFLSSKNQKRALGAQFKSHDGFMINSKNISAPEVGDIRIWYEIIKPQFLTVMGGLVNDTVGEYVTPHGELALIKPGKLNKDMLVAAAAEENRIWKWGLRLLGFSMMWGGLFYILSTIAVFISVIPALGYLIRWGIHLLSVVVAFVLSTATIMLSWFAVRPLWALVVFILLGGMSVLLKWRFSDQGKPAKTGKGRKNKL